MNGRVEDANAAIPMADIRSELSSVLLCYGTLQRPPCRSACVVIRPMNLPLVARWCGAQLLTYLRAVPLDLLDSW